MTRSHYVKRAQKDYPNAGIKKGEPYYWWSFRFGGKHRSKTAPKPSQLTQSSFWSGVYSAQERAEKVPDFDCLSSDRDEIVSDLESLRDETQEKFDNMPEGLQQGETGQTLEERVSALEDVISELEGVDCDVDLGDDIEDGAPVEGEEEETEEKKNERIAELQREKAEEIWAEVTSALEGVSCS